MGGLDEAADFLSICTDSSSRAVTLPGKLPLSVRDQKLIRALDAPENTGDCRLETGFFPLYIEKKKAADPLRHFDLRTNGAVPSSRFSRCGSLARSGSDPIELLLLLFGQVSTIGGHVLLLLGGNALSNPRQPLRLVPGDGAVLDLIHRGMTPGSLAPGPTRCPGWVDAGWVGDGAVEVWAPASVRPPPTARTSNAKLIFLIMRISSILGKFPVNPVARN